MFIDHLNDAAGGSAGPTDLARILGVPRPTFYRWMRDGRVTKTSDIAKLIAAWERRSPEPPHGSAPGTLAMWQIRRDALIAGLCGL
jgi:hypothetical protein